MIPPINSAFNLKRVPKIEPMVVPKSEKRKLTNAMSDMPNQSRSGQGMKITPVANASIEVATASKSK